MQDGAEWLFGYGSLIWRPEFQPLERSAALLSGWVRRFWQASVDHRGVPAAPGRVVTLVPEQTGHCWGVAFRIAAPELSAVVAELDHRERGGFRRQRLSVELRGHPAREVQAWVYLAAPENPNYAGPAPLQEIARQVRGANGPSGSNAEYVRRLAAALRELGVEDGHVYELESLL